jgi:hypothetical protein
VTRGSDGWRRGSDATTRSPCRRLLDAERRLLDADASTRPPGGVTRGADGSQSGADAKPPGSTARADRCGCHDPRVEPSGPLSEASAPRVMACGSPAAPSGPRHSGPAAPCQAQRDRGQRSVEPDRLLRSPPRSGSAAYPAARTDKHPSPFLPPSRRIPHIRNDIDALPEARPDCLFQPDNIPQTLSPRRVAFRAAPLSHSFQGTSWTRPPRTSLLQHFFKGASTRALIRQLAPLVDEG